MFGVVLWSDTQDRKAVFWCEDQGDLAYYDGSDEAVSQDGSGFFDAGDMVFFDIRVDRKLRKAINAELIEQQAGTDLPAALRKDASQPRKSAKIVPFVTNTKRARVGQTGLRKKA